MTTPTSPTFIHTTQCQYGHDCAAPGQLHLQPTPRPATPAPDYENMPFPYQYTFELAASTHEREQLKHTFIQSVNRDRWRHIFNERVKVKK
jgi:hypothetical protein